MGRIPESLLVVYIMGPMPRTLSFPVYVFLKLMLPCEHPFVSKIRVSFLVVSIRVIYLFFELSQSLFLWVFLPVEISRLVRIVGAFCWHKVINQNIKPHFVTARVVHRQTGVDAIMNIFFVVFPQLLLKPPYLFKLWLLEIVGSLRSEPLLVPHVSSVRPVTWNHFLRTCLRAFVRGRSSARLCWGVFAVKADVALFELAWWVLRIHCGFVVVDRCEIDGRTSLLELQILGLLFCQVSLPAPSTCSSSYVTIPSSQLRALRVDNWFEEGISPIFIESGVHKSVSCHVLCLFVDMGVCWWVKPDCSSVRVNWICIWVKTNWFEEMLHSFLILPRLVNSFVFFLLLFVFFRLI